MRTSRSPGRTSALKRLRSIPRYRGASRRRRRRGASRRVRVGMGSSGEELSAVAVARETRARVVSRRRHAATDWKSSRFEERAAARASWRVPRQPTCRPQKAATAEPWPFILPSHQLSSLAVSGLWRVIAWRCRDFFRSMSSRCSAAVQLRVESLLVFGVAERQAGCGILPEGHPLWIVVRPERERIAC